MTQVIFPKIPTAATCAVPARESCLLGRSKKRSSGVSKANHVPDKDGIIARKNYEVGYFISTDQLVVHTYGRLPTGYKHKRCHNHFNEGTIYNDAASGLI